MKTTKKMKITVITGPDGEVHGTLSHPEGGPTGHPGGRPILVAGPGQVAHEIELPEHLEGVKSAEELHRGLSDYLRSRPQSGQP
jgi:hypothetical protein